MAATFLQLCLVASVSVYVYGTETVCNCSASDVVMDCSYQNCLKFPTCPETIKVLKISGNGINELYNDYFQKCQYSPIKEIYLDNNNISKVDEFAFFGLNHVTTIDLSDNNISTIKLDYKVVRELSSFSLAGNPLISVNFPDTLKSLNLSSCQLVSGGDVIKDLRGLGKLKNLDLSSNNLTDWGEILDHMSRMPKLESIHVAGNPWECDCTMDRSQDIRNVVLGDDPVCASPKVVSGKSLWDFPCPMPTTTTATTTTPSTTTIPTTEITTSSAPDDTTEIPFASSDTNTNSSKPQVKAQKVLNVATVYSVTGFLIFVIVAGLGVELHARTVKKRVGDNSLWWQDEDRINGSFKYKYENIFTDDSD